MTDQPIDHAKLAAEQAAEARGMEPKAGLVWVGSAIVHAILAHLDRPEDPR